MTHTTKRRRGRPKGTGIDDSQTLLFVAGILSTQPMSVTAAIRAAGVTDPSHIRRVRDKFNAAARDVALFHLERKEAQHAHDGL